MCSLIRLIMFLSPAVSRFKLPRFFFSTSSPPPLHSDHRRELADLLQGRVSTTHLLQIHARVFRLDYHNDDLIATRLIGQYGTQFALRVLHNLPSPNIFPFNAAIRVFSESNTLASSAFSIFKLLKHRSLLPNDFTFSFLLKACFRSGDVRHLWKVHSHVVKSGYDSNESVVSGLLLVYAKGVRDVSSARKVFDGLIGRGNVGWWTCLIAGYSQINDPEEALMLFVKMINQDVVPADETMVSVLSSCSKISKVEKWVDKFLELRHGSGVLVSESVDTVLIYLCGKSGEVEKSCEVFNKMIERKRESLVAWNAMMSCYVQNGHPIEALNLFNQMIETSAVKPNHVTMVSLLSACSQVGNIDLGKWAHGYIKSHGRGDVLQSNTILATALIDMYSKCGSLERAKEVFLGIDKKDTVIYNAMIMGLAVNGKGEEAIQVFNEFRNVGRWPNEATFLGLLSACVHTGFISEGCTYFRDMEPLYSIKPKLEHYACYVDLLARAGRIEEALYIVVKMPFEANEQIWGALLGACLIHHRSDLAQIAAKRLVNTDPQSSAGYVLLSNAYATDLQWGEIAELRGMMRKKGVKKQVGCSWITVDGVAHDFWVGCRSHLEIERIHLMLDTLYREILVKVH